ncbi:MAG: CDP-alcohol phosphatidyltransferase family protein [Bacteroidia bacterium]
MKTKAAIFTLPNALSFYRIVIAPAIVWSLITEERAVFITLIGINLVTDILDGYIARRYNLCTELGARLDSLADIGTFLLAISGFWIFEHDFVMAHKAAFITLFCFYSVPQILSLLKFSRPTSFHLYSNKAVGYIQGIFIFTFFLFGYWDVYFYFMVAASCLADFEVFLLVLLLPKLASNAKTIVHALKGIKR